MKKGKLALLSIISLLVFAGCNNNEPAEESSITINLLTTGWINTPTSGKDPYKEWIKDNYGLDVNLTATADFNAAALTKFASKNDVPDIVSIPSLSEFQKLKNQGTIIEDWTPYLKYMPNYGAFIKREENKFLTDLFTTDGKLTCFYTYPDSVTWSLKIREDWAEEYRSDTTPGENYPAGNVATNNGPWQPLTSDDLLHFARWIKINKNSNPDKPDVFGFSTAGAGNDFGVLGTWFPLMWGYNYLCPYGFYVDETTNQASFGVVDGTMEKMLNYMRTICDEELIDPNWFIQDSSSDLRTKGGKIGITWYPGIIAEMTANTVTNQDTSNWWKTYDVPIGVDAIENSPTKPGMMINDSLASNMITVSKKCALNENKMKKICALLDDLLCYVDNTKTGQDKYVKGKAYDALRYGVGVDADLTFQDVEGTDFKYCCVKTGNTYRETVAGDGAWDWGAWFSTTNDGVVTGEAKQIGKIAKQAVQFNTQSGQYEQKIQVGSFLAVDQSIVKNMDVGVVKFMYNYVTRQSSQTMEEFEQYWRSTLKGDELLQEATRQFRAIGFIK